MFRQIIVFTRDSKLSSCLGITHAAFKLNIPYFFFNPFSSPYTELLALIGQRPTLIVPRTSGVLFDDWDLTLLEHCINLGAKSTHCPQAIALLRDKDRQYLHLTSAGLPCVPTLIHRGPLQEQHLRNFQTSKLWVLKANRGNKGIGHQLLNTQELLNFWQSALVKNDQRYIIQPFYEKTCELRLLVIGDESYLLNKEQGSSWKKNASSSNFNKAEASKAQKHQLTIIEEKIKEVIGLESFAVDLFAATKDKEGCSYEILEVNAHPGMSAATEALENTNLYQKFLNYFVTKHQL